ARSRARAELRGRGHPRGRAAGAPAAARAAHGPGRAGPGRAAAMTSSAPAAVPKLKVLTLVGTRPEVIKMSRVLAELDAHTPHVISPSGQNSAYGLTQVFLEELGRRPPDRVLGAVGAPAAETIGLVISRADAVLAREQPDAVVLYGDTNTCLA